MARKCIYVITNYLYTMRMVGYAEVFITMNLIRKTIRNIAEMFRNTKAQMGGVVGSIVGLFTGVGIVVLLIIMIGVLAGQAYTLTAPNIATISNTTIKSTVTESIYQGFVGLQTGAQYLPLVILAVVISIVLALVLGLGVFGRGSGGSAL